MEWVFQGAAEAAGWPEDSGCFPEMPVPAVASLDDSVLWERGAPKLQAKLRAVVEEMKDWGLFVNLSKCKVHRSPDADQGPITLEGVEIPCVDHLEVMGLCFSVTSTCCELMQTVLSKARKKFWACKHVVCGPGPLADRIRYFDKVVTGSALWCAAAILPDRQALQMVNGHMFMMVGWMMGLGRRPGEDWLSSHVRGLRAARAMVHKVLKDRWSTKWLRRVWRYTGHRARALYRTYPPASSLMNEYRSRPWWVAQQADLGGIRHPGRFFPKLGNHETVLDSVCKGPWRVSPGTEIGGSVWRMSG